MRLEWRRPSFKALVLQSSTPFQRRWQPQFGQSSKSKMKLADKLLLLVFVPLSSLVWPPAVAFSTPLISQPIVTLVPP